MAGNVNITANADGKTLEVLSGLIEKRARALNETSRDACIATAINVVTSLKSASRKAPLKANKKMYFNVRQTGMVAGWEKSGGKIHRVARSPGPSGRVDRTITRMCRNLAGQKYIKNEFVGVWMFQLFNENPKKTVYYCFAKNEKQVRDYAEQIIIKRMLRKESGMNRYALGVAQAKLSTKSPPMAERGNKQFKAAYGAANIKTGLSSMTGASGTFFVEVRDDLRYSLLALKGGQSALDVALKKAANKTYGLVRKAWADHSFTDGTPPSQAPFPEVQRKRR